MKDSKNNRNDYEKQVVKAHVDKIRERVRDENIDDVTDLELIEYFLNIDAPYKDYRDLAAQLLERYTSINNLITTDIYELCNSTDLTDNKAILFGILPDLMYEIFGKETYYAKTLKELKESLRFKIIIPKENTFWTFGYDENQKLIDFFNIPYSQEAGRLMHDHTFFQKIAELNPRYVAFYFISNNYTDAIDRMREFLLSIYKKIEAFGLNILDGCVFCNNRIHSVFVEIKNPNFYDKLPNNEKELAKHYSPIFHNKSWESIKKEDEENITIWMNKM